MACHTTTVGPWPYAESSSSSSPPPTRQTRMKLRCHTPSSVCFDQQTFLCNPSYYWQGHRILCNNNGRIAAVAADDRFLPVKTREQADFPSSFISSTGEQVLAHGSNPHVSFSDKIDALCREGHLDRALDVLLLLEQHSTIPFSRFTYWSLLKLCGRRKALSQAMRVHTCMALHGLELNGSLAEYLVVTSANCGGFDDALRLFHKLSDRTIYSWTAVISIYVDLGKGREALHTYDCMQVEGVQPNEYTFVSLFKACGSIPDLKEGKRMHAAASKYNLASSLYAGACLVDMYSKCGSINDAQKVFDGLSHRDAVSWTAILSAYVEQGQPEKALRIYKKMKEEGVSQDPWTLASALQACCILAEKEEAAMIDGLPIKTTSLELGQALYDDACKQGLESGVFVCNILVQMYGKCRSLLDAQKVFSGMPHQDSASWTAMMSVYIELGQGAEVLNVYREMQIKGKRPDKQAFLFALQACGMLAEEEEAVAVEGQLTKTMCLETGKEIGADAQKQGLDSDPFVASALIIMYGKCGGILEAEKVFAALSRHDLVLWTALLSAYTGQNQGDKALRLYRQMKSAGFSPNEHTLVVALQACCNVAEREEPVLVEGQMIKVVSLNIGRDLHADAQRNGIDSDAFVANTLVFMYGKCGSIVEAEKVWGRLSQQTAVSWSTMLLVYMEHDKHEKALQLVEQMQKKGVALDDTVLNCALQACCKTGSLETCRQIHEYVVSAGYDLSCRTASSPEYEPALLLANTLINAYGFSGSMSDAQAVFDVLPQPNVVTWGVLIAGYARAGNYVTSLQTFEKMQDAQVKPNAVTFISLLSACSKAGLVDKGVHYFESMSKEHGIEPEVEHYGSMIDLLGRAGDFACVKHMMSKMLLKPDLTTWLSLLSACHKHGNVRLGKEAFNQAIALDPNDGAPYVLMSNIYADAGLWDIANGLKMLRQKQAVT